jgi:hypothetical protein
VNVPESLLPEIEKAVNELMPTSGPHRIQALMGQSDNNKAPTIEIPANLLG